MNDFEAQVRHLLELDYPALLGIDPEAFAAAVEPLRERVPAVSQSAGDGSSGRVPFVIVLNSPLVTAEVALSKLSRRGQPALESLYPREVGDFATIETVSLPAGDAYLLVDVDRGAETINVTPNEAFERITAQGRTPLTIPEGLALLTHYPELLQPNNCFSLLGSRAGDKRVPALWLSEKRPKLGWCWAGNPHTWLGSASAGSRAGADVDFS